jgi:hypothetical protein
MNAFKRPIRLCAASILEGTEIRGHVISAGQNLKGFSRCLAVTSPAEEGVLLAIGCGLCRTYDSRPRLAIAGAKGPEMEQGVQVKKLTQCTSCL